MTAGAPPLALERLRRVALQRGANGVVHLRENGNLTEGTGNYKGIKGGFTLAGSYSTKTNHETFMLRGEATF